jgi:hypothetical protein
VGADGVDAEPVEEDEDEVGRPRPSRRSLMAAIVTGKNHL